MKLLTQIVSLLWFLSLLSCTVDKKEPVKEPFVDATKEKRQELLAALKIMEGITYESGLEAPNAYTVDGKLVQNERHLLLLRQMFYAFSYEKGYNLFHGMPKDISLWFDGLNNAPASHIASYLERYVQDRKLIKRNTPFNLIEIKRMPRESLPLEAYRRGACTWSEAFLSSPAILRAVLYFDQNVRKEYLNDSLYRYFRTTLLNTRRGGTMHEADYLELTIMHDSLYVEGVAVGLLSHHTIWQDSLFHLLQNHYQTYQVDTTHFFPEQRVLISATIDTPVKELLRLRAMLGDVGYRTIRAFSLLRKTGQSVGLNLSTLDDADRQQLQSDSAILERHDSYAILSALDTTQGDSCRFSILSISPEHTFEIIGRAAFKAENVNYREHTVLIDTTESLCKLPLWGSDSLWGPFSLKTYHNRFLRSGEIVLATTEGQVILPQQKVPCPHIDAEGSDKKTAALICTRCGFNTPSLKRNRHPVISGTRYEQAILRMVRGNYPQLKKAHKKRLKERPGLDGNVTLQWGINAAGKTTYCRVVQSSLNDETLERRLEQIVKKWSYAKLTDSTDFTECTYPFILQHYPTKEDSLHVKHAQSLHPQTVSALLQAIVDHPPFKMYLHIELAERKQLYLSRKNLQGTHPTVTVAGRKVQLVDSLAKEKNCLQISTINQVSPHTFFVSLQYTIEGVKATIKLEKLSGEWQVLDALIQEQ